MNDDVVTEHPSFGVLRFSKTSHSHDQNLFGSSIKHRNTIRLELCHARKHRHLHYDSFMSRGGGHIVEVEMSPTQFADLITSPNVGDGIPVTIRWLQGTGNVEPPPGETKRAEFEAEFKQSVRAITEDLKSLVAESKTILAKPNLVKADREKLRELLERIERDTRSNLPFIQAQFNEQLDKSVTEAKGEVEGFFHNIVTGLGVEHLAERLEQIMPALPENASTNPQITDKPES